MKYFKRLDDLIEKAEGWALIMILSVMMVVAFIQVVLRNVFSSGISWGDGLTRALVLWAGFLGASLAVKQGRYINIDVISRLLSDRAKRVSRVCVYLFSSVVCFFMGLASVNFVKMEYDSATQYSIGIDSWIIELVIPSIFFFLTFRFSLKMIGILSGEPLEKQEWER
ncbi:MAG: hypothetical protein A2428_17420 [Bdellovibrionales bacterium RIFOXYC1_FULL_54_43]|nr:MAG: hypothetical protein A2428_17420 [Bdellovibrionales bacterium RIFOXYC1_FULL_54_43]OFZ83420.1 MAG: hypothetical protein A2603_05690 [Bdellovibrionales bacterium RIFOXYD1_FULL_55_31]